MRAPVGLSLHIGVNRINSAHYGTDGALAGCEFDAADMEAIAASRRFETEVLLSEQATSTAVTSAIASAASALRPGDIFVLTYAGHGAQVPDLNDDEAQDGKDETWCLYDRMLVDDELWALWGSFARTVRIVVVSDSCHSGSVTRRIAFPPPPGRHRNLPREAAVATYRANQSIYDGIQTANIQGDNVGVGASVLLLSGCLDSQLSGDGDRNGAYTEQLKRVWADGAFAGGYATFQAAIREVMPPEQAPAYSSIGFPSPLFEAQTPFTI
jgi:metacaspase-1